MIKINHSAIDSVIKSKVGIGYSSYQFAIEKIYPLVNRFGAQRKLQDKKFYERLRRDIVNGCLMPPITLAFVSADALSLSDELDIEDFVNREIENGFVLDGMQRLNSLRIAKEEMPDYFPGEQPIFINVVIAESKDKLIYRMITLNNGQRPMTARHQIEILTQELFDFDELDIDVQSEKERADKIVRGAFNLADISSAYVAFLTGSLIVDNNKIIGEKMDQILVGKIMDQDISAGGVEFKDVLTIVDVFAQNLEAKKWLKVSNNLIGFSVAIKKSYDCFQSMTSDEFSDAVQRFDAAFKAINPAKVNLGRYRRELVKYFIERFARLGGLDVEDLEAEFAEVTASFDE